MLMYCDLWPEELKIEQQTVQSTGCKFMVLTFQNIYGKIKIRWGFKISKALQKAMGLIVQNQYCTMQIRQEQQHK